jgi:hypothetical protein
LNLVTEDEVECWVVFFQRGEDALLVSIELVGGVNLIEFIDHFLGEGADVVDPQFNCMSTGLANSMACEARIECHDCRRAVVKRCR